MPVKKRKPAKKRSVEPEKDGGKDPKETKPSVESRPTSGARPEKDTGPAGSFSANAPFPIVGIGAPADVFLKPVSERLDALFVLPPHHPVSNAVGAVAGSVMVDKEAILYEQATEDRRTYRVQVDGRVRHFSQEDEAQRYARRMAAEAALAAARSAGAVDPQVDMRITADGSLQRVLARAVGSPTLASDVMLSLRPLAKRGSQPPARAITDEA